MISIHLVIFIALVVFFAYQIWRSVEHKMKRSEIQAILEKLSLIYL